MKTTQNYTRKIYICYHKMSLGCSYNTAPGEMWINVFSLKLGNQVQNKIMIPKSNVVNPRLYWVTYRSSPKADVSAKPIPAWTRAHKKLGPRAHCTACRQLIRKECLPASFSALAAYITSGGRGLVNRVFQRLPERLEELPVSVHRQWLHNTHMTFQPRFCFFFGKLS